MANDDIEIQRVTTERFSSIKLFIEVKSNSAYGVIAFPDMQNNVVLTLTGLRALHALLDQAIPWIEEHRAKEILQNGEA